jgi:hypothetical protein
MQFNDRTTILQDFVADHAAGQRVGRTGGGPTALHNALYVALKELEKQAQARERRVIAPPTARTRRPRSAMTRCSTSRARPRSTSTPSACARGVQDRNAVKFSQAAHL